MGNEVNVDDEKATAESFTHNCKIKAGMMSAKGKVTGKLEGGKISGDIKGS
jgi:hypothetical protein